ncbi:MAG: hypothetical protein IJ017_05545 [Oscillospiraceae bacterium]|nr:hypothetical protein [Oscillospiraceae bacterium]
MEKQKIYSAFDNIILSKDSANRMLDNILSASEISPERKDGNMKRIGKKPLLIAAVVIVMLLTMGAVIVKLSASDLVIGESFFPGKTYTDNEGNEITIPDETRDIISLQGVQDSPNFKAVQEWRDFKDSYDPDFTLLHEADANGFVRPEAYHAYGVYTQEMIDKVDEIANKYGLKLAGAITMVQKEEKDIFFDTLGFSRLHREDFDEYVSYRSGYFYECGNFQFNFSIKTPNNTSLSCDMRYCDKAYFDTVAFSVDVDKTKQYNYTTSDGTEVLLMIADEWARIFCDREDAFITISIFNFSSSTTIALEDVKYAADAIDFSIKPNV